MVINTLHSMKSVGGQTFSFVNFARFGSIPPIAMATKEEEETIFVCVKVCGGSWFDDSAVLIMSP